MQDSLAQRQNRAALAIGGHVCTENNAKAKLDAMMLALTSQRPEDELERFIQQVSQWK